MPGPVNSQSRPQGQQQPGWRDWLTCGGCLVVVAALIGGGVLAFNAVTDGASSSASSSSSSSSSSGSGAGGSASYTPTPQDPYTDDPYSSPSAPPPPDPYDSGTCLNGTLPDSTTAQEVDDVEEVDCSASDAHYKVIETIPMTSDLSRCSSNTRTEYAFSSRYTINGATINEYVYCLVGLGAYARK